MKPQVPFILTSGAGLDSLTPKNLWYSDFLKKTYLEIRGFHSIYVYFIEKSPDTNSAQEGLCLHCPRWRAIRHKEHRQLLCHVNN